MLLVWILLIITRKRVMITKVSGWGTALLFFGWLLLSVVAGIASGGEFLPALWEIRALFYLGAMFFIVPQIIQSKEQVRQFVWVIIAALSFKMLQGVVRVANLGFSFGRRDELTLVGGITTFIDNVVSAFSVPLTVLVLAVAARRRLPTLGQRSRVRELHATDVGSDLQLGLLGVDGRLAVEPQVRNRHALHTVPGIEPAKR